MIFCHGAGYDLDGSLGAGVLTEGTYHLKLIQTLSKYFTVFTSDFDVTQSRGIWGCEDHIAFIEDARLYLESEYGTSGKVTLAGVSMGGGGVLNYTRKYPSNVRALAPITAVIDMQAWWNYLDPSGRTSIDMVYPPYYTDAAYGALYNPAVWASTLDPDIPVKLFYSTADVPPFYATVPAWLAARPSTLAQNYPGGHAEAGLVYMLDDVVKFLRYPNLG